MRIQYLNLIYIVPPWWAFARIAPGIHRGALSYDVFGYRMNR